MVKSHATAVFYKTERCCSLALHDDLQFMTVVRYIMVMRTIFV